MPTSPLASVPPAMARPRPASLTLATSYDAGPTGRLRPRGLPGVRLPETLLGEFDRPLRRRQISDRRATHSRASAGSCAAGRTVLPRHAELFNLGGFGPDARLIQR